MGWIVNCRRITGNKTLQKIGMDLALPEALDWWLMVCGMSATKGISSLSGAMDDVLTSPVKGSKMVDRSADLWKAPGAKTGLMDKSADLWSKDALVGSQNLPKSNLSDSIKDSIDPGSWIKDKVFDTWAKYYPWMSIAGVHGDVYMLNERMDMEKIYEDALLILNKHN